MTGWVLAGTGGCLFQPGGRGRGVAKAAAVVTVTASAAAARAARMRAKRPRARAGFMTVSLVLVGVAAPVKGGLFPLLAAGGDGHHTEGPQNAHRKPRARGASPCWSAVPARGAAGGAAALAVAGCGRLCGVPGWPWCPVGGRVMAAPGVLGRLGGIWAR